MKRDSLRFCPRTRFACSPRCSSSSREPAPIALDPRDVSSCLGCRSDRSARVPRAAHRLRASARSWLVDCDQSLHSSRAPSSRLAWPAVSFVSSQSGSVVDSRRSAREPAAGRPREPARARGRRHPVAGLDRVELAAGCPSWSRYPAQAAHDRRVVSSCLSCRPTGAGRALGPNRVGSWMTHYRREVRAGSRRSKVHRLSAPGSRCSPVLKFSCNKPCNTSVA
jgi:hypothetical protein